MDGINRSSAAAERFSDTKRTATPGPRNGRETPLRRKTGPARIQLTELFRPEDERQIRLAAQVGVRHAIVDVQPSLKSVPTSRYSNVLKKIKQQFQNAGMAWVGV